MNKALYGLPAHLCTAEGIEFGKTPLDYISINIPPVCNYRCDKCFTWANKRPLDNYIGVSKIIDIISEAKELGAKVVTILGEGEPLLCEDFKKIVEHVNKLGMITFVATNGSLLDEEMTNFCYEHNVTLAISMDTLNESLYRDMYKGSADLNRTLKNLEYARKIYSKSIFEKNGVKVYRLCIHTTVSANNYLHLKELTDYCGEDIYFSCEHIAKIGVANDNDKIYGGKEDNTIYNTIKNASHSTMRPMVIAESCNVPLACCFFYYGITIGFEGEIMLDTHAIETKQKIGNVTEFENLNSIIEISNKLKNVFFESFGGGYCIIRDEKYHEFLEFLSTWRNE